MKHHEYIIIVPHSIPSVAYGQVPASLIKTPIKAGLKRCAQLISASFGPHTRRQQQPALVILMYHRVLPPDDERTRFEEPGMVVSPVTFRKHMELIRARFQPVRLDDWARRCANGEQVPNRACAITFDDGWGDNFEFAYPILRETGTPATIFLVSDMIGTNSMFWPELLARTLVHLSEMKLSPSDNKATRWLSPLLPEELRKLQQPPSREQLSVAIRNAKSYTDDQIRHLLDTTITSLGIDVQPVTSSLLDWKQVSEMTASGLIEAASHTRRHTRLVADTAPETLESEICGSKADITQKTGMPVTSFCFPNGDYTMQALDVVRSSYLCAVTTERGWNRCTDGLHNLRRIAIHEDIAQDRTAFLARLSGWI